MQMLFRAGFCLVSEILQHRMVKNTNLVNSALEVPCRHSRSEERSVA